MIGTCNGLVCLVSNANYFDCEAIVIWNPSVGKFVVLPWPSVTLTRLDSTKRVASYALAYDSCDNDYKVLRTISHFSGPTEVEVWSLANSSWRSVSFIEGFVSFREPTFVNGTFHWTQRYPKNRANRIVSFDMVSESFREIMIPQVCLTEEVLYHILSYGENLAFFVVESVRQNGYACHMWVMTEYGVAESWTKLFTVCLQNMIHKPFISRKCGELVLKMVDGRVILVDPQTKEAKYFRKDGCEYYFMDSYVESRLT